MTNLLTTLVFNSEAVSEPKAMDLDVESLYRRYGDMVLGRCRALLRDEEDARDACQEVFLRVYRYRFFFRGEASPSTYLFRVTTTTCLNRLRSRRRRPEDPVEELPAAPDDGSLLDRHELQDLLDRLLKGADEKTQSCLIYHYVDGMTHQEVGDLLGLSAAAVRKRISKFREGLRESPPAWLKEDR